MVVDDHGHASLAGSSIMVSVGKAISCCEKAIQIQPNYVNARNNLGLILSELGEHEKAISCCEKAIHIEPNNHACTLEMRRK